jgi:hypothetical protein
MGATPEQMTAEQIKAAVDNLSLGELEEVFDHVLAVQAERKAPHLASDESALLVRINRAFPEELRERLPVLLRKREDGAISDAEYDELTTLTERAEELHAERVGALVELAKLRGVSLPALMDQLGIRFPQNV